MNTDLTSELTPLKITTAPFSLAEDVTTPQRRILTPCCWPRASGAAGRRARGRCRAPRRRARPAERAGAPPARAPAPRAPVAWPRAAAPAPPRTPSAWRASHGPSSRTPETEFSESIGELRTFVAIFFYTCLLTTLPKLQVYLKV